MSIPSSEGFPLSLPGSLLLGLGFGGAGRGWSPCHGLPNGHVSQNGFFFLGYGGTGILRVLLCDLGKPKAESPILGYPYFETDPYTVWGKALASVNGRHRFPEGFFAEGLDREQLPSTSVSRFVRAQGSNKYHSQLKQPNFIKFHHSNTQSHGQLNQVYEPRPCRSIKSGPWSSRKQL